MAASNDNTVTLISDGAAAIPQYSMVSTDNAGNIGLAADAITRTVGIAQEGIPAAVVPGTPIPGQPTAVQVLGVSYAIAGPGGFAPGFGATLALMADPAGSGRLIAHNAGGAPTNLHCANWTPTATQAVAGAAAGSLIRVLIVPCPVTA